MFPGARIQVFPATWEAQRHRRGPLRWYPFDALLQVGTASAGSFATLQTPWVRMVSGVSGPAPDYRSRTMCEKNLDRWRNHPNLELFWAANHYAQCFVYFEFFTITGAGKNRAGIFLHDPGNSVAVGMNLTTPGSPLVCLFAWRDAADNRGWELVTAVGDGTPATITQLAGVEPPTFSGDPGPQGRMRRMEIYYRPAEYVAAWIDGVEGARTTLTLPDVNRSSLAGDLGPGAGVWNDGTAGDLTIADFMSLLLESPDYIG